MAEKYGEVPPKFTLKENIDTRRINFGITTNGTL